MTDVKYEDLPIVFQSDGAATEEIELGVWLFIHMTYILERSREYVPGS